MSKLLNFVVCGLVVLMATGCETLTEERQAELNRTADYAIAKLLIDRPEVQGALNAATGVVVADIIRPRPYGAPTPVNGMLVCRSDGFRYFIKVNNVRFEGAEGVVELTAVILLSDSAELQQVLDGELILNQSSGKKIYITAEGKRFAAYPLSSARVEPEISYSSDVVD